MSEERTPNDGSAITADDKAAANAVAESLASKKARIARVLERGIIGERLAVNVPTGIHGEWVADDPVEIDRMRSLGYEVDKEFAQARSIHTNADGVPKVGDAIFMTCPQEQYDLIRAVKQERFEAMHNPRGKGREKEEAEYRGKVEEETPEVPVIDASKKSRVGEDEIRRALAGN